MRRLTPLIAFALAACADSASAPVDGLNLARLHEAEGSHGGTPFVAVLERTTEVPNPPGGDPSPTAGGIALVTLNSGQEEVCFEVTFSGLTSPVNDAHIHEGAAGVRGPIIIRLAQPEYPAFPAATAGSAAHCVFAPRDLIKRIRDNPELFYVNVHTRTFPTQQPNDRPGGAIRGQLERAPGSEVNN